MKKLLVFAVLASAVGAQDFKAGVARLNITPEGPIWMSGYAARTKPSEGKLTDLWAKALALEDNKGGRFVVVTVDLIGLPRSLAEEVAARVQKRWGLDRARLLLNASHTHTGPVVYPNLMTMFELDPAQERVVKEYARMLADRLVEVAGAALGDLAPAYLAFGQGQVGFAVNRRQFTPKGVQLGVNPDGPVDHSVPVLRVSNPDGTIKAVLFGYACHCTTLTAEHYKISGDYAAYAQMEVERAYPGATAMFLTLCAGDQNPNPRSQEELAVRHGKSLGAEVVRVLTGEVKPVRPPIRAAFQVVDLRFAPHTREQFEKELASGDRFRAARARQMLKAYDERRPVRQVPYPVQAVRLNNDLTLVALGGEVVVDYALRAKREFPKETLVVAAYSNDVMCYIPSLRVLREGGYEADTSMIYYGQPGPFSEEVEETVFRTIHQVLRRVGVKGGR